MRSLPLKQQIANHRIRCDLCPNEIAPGERFWQVGQGAGKGSLLICPSHIPLNTTRILTESHPEGWAITYVRPEALDVRSDLVPGLLNDWEKVYSLTPEEFEELVFDRLVAMGLQAIRLGPANQKDGGIDIIFWTCTVFPMLGAVQVKHHRTPKRKTGSSDIRDLAAAMRSYYFNIGLVVTNTSFTDEARFESEKNGSPPIQLRDGEALRKWIADDFRIEELNFVTRTIEVCKGLGVNVPRFL